VNLSSRLESVTKEYGCDIILSEYTYGLCRDKVWVRELDTIRVKGKHKAVKIYELLGDARTPLTAEMEEFLEIYSAGRTAYTSSDFETAIRYFKMAKRLRSDDQAVAVHINRAKDYLVNPPPQPWDGVHIMMTK
jgi:adenylate cyclase